MEKVITTATELFISLSCSFLINKTINQWDSLISQQQLQPYNTPAAHKPITTLRRLLTIVKVKDNRRTDVEQYKDQMLRLPVYLHR